MRNERQGDPAQYLQTTNGSSEPLGSDFDVEKTTQRRNDFCILDIFSPLKSKKGKNAIQIYTSLDYNFSQFLFYQILVEFSANVRS